VNILKKDAILSTERLVKFWQKGGRLFLLDTGVPIGPGPPHYRDFTITLSYTNHIRKDSSGRAISPTQIPPPDNTQQSQDKNIHGPGGIRTHNARKRWAADPRLRQRGHRDQWHDVLAYNN
jgi:hypothetical protein